MGRTKDTEKTVQVIPAVEKALDILEYVARRESAVTVKELSTDLGLPVATAYRTVNYLCQRNYLKESSIADGRYVLGSQVMMLAQQSTIQRDLIHLARPLMRELATRSGQTAQLGVLQDYSVIYIEQALPARPVNIMAALRTSIPVNVSASGKILVAHLPETERQSFLEQAQLARHTPESIVEFDRFQDELEQVHVRGYALDREEYARGIGCVAAPIRDHHGYTIAAIGITGHISDYLDVQHVDQLIQWVKDCAANISECLA
jgi:DNA-binding IclR family transcriptional regulator